MAPVSVTSIVPPCNFYSGSITSLLLACVLTHPAAVLPSVPVLVALLGRMSQEPAGSHPVGRGWAELFVPRPEAIQLMRPTRLAQTVNNSEGSTGLAT